MIRGFIFDLDGVLVNTPDLHYRAWKKLTNKLEIGFSRKDYENLKGLGRVSSFQQILKWSNRSVSPSEFESLIQQKNQWYLELLSETGNEIILPGVLNFLEESQKLALRLAVGSASKNARMILEQTQLERYFETIVDGNHTTHFKPHPEVFERVGNHLKLPPSELVVFEDSQAGVQAAKNGGFKSVGIGKPDFLKNADLVLECLAHTSPQQLINQLISN